MYIVKKDFFILFRIIISCITAILTVFFISSLLGEDLLKNNDVIDKLKNLSNQITTQLNGEIDKRITVLGEIPEMDPYKKFYCVELAKEIHDISFMSEKQKILFDTYNVRDFENRLKFLLMYTKASDVNSLLEEIETVKRELKNTVNIIEKKKNKMIRQRIAYIVFFIVLWIFFFLYYSRGIILKKIS